MIIIDDLPHETLWRLWAEQYDTDSSKTVQNLDNKNVKINAYSKQLSNSTELLAADETLEQPSHFLSADTIPNRSSTPPIPSLYSQEAVVTSGVKASLSRVNFLIHAKYPDKVKSGWVRDRCVPFHLKPGWGSLELTEVMIKMLDEVKEFYNNQISSFFRIIMASLLKTRYPQDRVSSLSQAINLCYCHLFKLYYSH